MLAFISHHHDDKKLAGRICHTLERIGITGFLAHEHIRVSQEWQRALMKALRRSDIFVAIISDRYFKSYYCIQEAGIAVYRGIHIIPLSVDDTVSKGFLSHIQSQQIDPENFDKTVIYEGIAEYDRPSLIDGLTAMFSSSNSYAEAERNFDQLHTYLRYASSEQKVTILEVAAENSQIRDCYACQPYIRSAFRRYGHLLDRGTRDYLERAIPRFEN